MPETRKELKKTALIKRYLIGASGSIQISEPGVKLF
jgi:hypothetical protein